MTTAWPPSIDELKTDLKIDPSDNREDARLAMDLDAAVAWAQSLKNYRFDLADPDQVGLPDPPKDFRLGTLRMAGRLNARRRSSDGMVSMGDLGVTRVTSYDNDIDRLLKIGKYAPMSEQFA